MATGIDTSLLVAAEVSSHPAHSRARAKLQSVTQAGEQLALAPQVLAEFIHIVTDPRRFTAPLDMIAALLRAEAWWNTPEVARCFPNDASTRTFLAWMGTHQLGRKRLLDSMLAATYNAADVKTVLTLNADDFKVFGCFELPAI
jgi:predicted nucleic acid-binding protein